MRDVTEDVKRVETMATRMVPVRRSWEGFGSATARDAADIPSEISAIVREVPDEIRPGAHVTHDQPIAWLSEVDIRHEMEVTKQTIARLEAQLASLDLEEKRVREQLDLVSEELEIATADYNRALESLKLGAANQSEVDAKRRSMNAIARSESEMRKQQDLIDPRRSELNASIAEQRARLEMVRTDLERCTIRSPIDGVLQTVDVNDGEKVQPGTRVARVVSLQRMEIPLRFPVSARQMIHAGDEVRLSAEGASSACWDAVISRLAPESDTQTRTCTVYAEVNQSPTDDPLLIPGQYLSARLESSRPLERLVVPRRAVFDDSVWIIDARGLAEQRRVDVAFYVVGAFPQVGPPDSEWVVLSEGSDLRPDDIVILSNLDELQPKMPIQGDIWTVDADGHRLVPAEGSAPPPGSSG